jgi:hypothetical protein
LWEFLELPTDEDMDGRRLAAVVRLENENIILRDEIDDKPAKRSGKVPYREYQKEKELERMTVEFLAEAAKLEKARERKEIEARKAERAAKKAKEKARIEEWKAERARKRTEKAAAARSSPRTTKPLPKPQNAPEAT